MATIQSTRRRSPGKPAKPRPDFPLFPHATRQWAKKIRGRTYYFGTWDDPDAAERLYRRQRADLESGRSPAPVHTDGGIMVSTAANLFLDAKHELVQSGDVGCRQFDDLRRVLGNMVKHFGKDRAVDSLRPNDFGLLRTKMAHGRGVYALRREIAGVRQLFRWLYDNDLIDRPVKMGSQFKSPSAKSMRLARVRTGNRAFTADEMRTLLKAAKPHVRAMILLGVNCGLGNKDIAFMRRQHVKGEWLDYPRNKTGVGRRAKLWPETLRAIQDAARQQPRAKREEHHDIVFTTRCGQPWGHDDKATSPIGHEFRKLLDATGIYRSGLSFYALRHTFRTVADSCKDQPAIDYVMGHVDPTMPGNYRQQIDDTRLEAVANCVHSWLFSKEQSAVE